MRFLLNLAFILISTCEIFTKRQDFRKGAYLGSKGLFPKTFNLASSSIITVNATCGEYAPEVFCKLSEDDLRSNDLHRSDTGESADPQCEVCDSSSSDKQHPISNAIDGTNRWWQGPTLQNGKQFEWVTITLDLGQVYQVSYVSVKAAISPRPGNLILERSLDGIIYKPWQYYALSDSLCWEAYGIRPTIGKPEYRSDEEVICTSYYSKLHPLENGEIHTSLVDGRPGADGPSLKLREFTKARYVRLRLQKIQTFSADFATLQSNDPEKIKHITRKYFYSIKDISIGGHCMCSGHAANCSYDRLSGKQHCKCEHNTCGENCEKCCPLYNQKSFKPGTSLDTAACTKCECFGHSENCHFDQNIAAKKASVNTEGKYEGGGVCDNCKHHTTGINCEQCADGYFRSARTPRNHTQPCKKCQCNSIGMTGSCIKDDSYATEGLKPGDCLCKAGIEGKKCDRCAKGYRNFPTCEPCPCHSAGTLHETCEGVCACKTHVEGPRCDRCKRGFYHLSADNPDGCSQCFCFGLTDECTEGDWGVKIIEKVEDWRVTDINGIRVVKPILEHRDVVIANDDMSPFGSYYYLAPPNYLGNKLYSYGADLKFKISYVVARGDTSGTYTENADVILEGNGEKLGYNWGVRPEADSVSVRMPLREQDWFILSPSAQRAGSVSREAFTLVLNNVTRLLIRAKFHTDQIEGRLHDIGMEIASEKSKSLKKLKSVEKCICPPGYGGLSCELCASGYQEMRNSVSLGVMCERCDCYNHAKSCDPETGRCNNCQHHTTGLKCDRCVRGFYGDATIGTQDDCKPCACPLEEAENNFSPTCHATDSLTGEKDYICDHCLQGYTGDKCERCSEGYFGNPQIPGGYCQPCSCSGNADTSSPGWCDSLTGQCLKCLGNTGGWNCGECLPGNYGNPEHRSCIPCSCDANGSLSPQCHHTTGQCICKPRFVGRTCDRCTEGYGNVGANCIPCKCAIGSRSEKCDPVTGHCLCKRGVFGTKCDSCQENHYGFSHQGCQECNCNLHGSTSATCNENNGQCTCKLYVTGRACDRCEDGYWNLESGVGCEVCHCNRSGSSASLCDKNTGQCTCKPGIGGKLCDQCLPGYFKFTTRGCHRCDPCDAPGHICDPENGRCVCPPFTTGRRCQKCVPNAYRYHPLNGCIQCICNPQGSPSQRCDSETGDCICLEGFEGRHCDQCRHGFYNFPNCHKCDCDKTGTDTSKCGLRDGVCHCNVEGQCLCKEYATGRKCNKCIDGAFDLSADNTKGCHKCFCFGRTHICEQANMFWSHAFFPSQDVFMEVGTSEIPRHFGFQVIPHDLSGRRLGIPYVLDKPLYWSIPKEQLGDKVLSYNGYLRFNVESHSASHFPDALLEGFPVAILQGNHRIILMHSHSSSPRRSFKIRLNEEEWKNLDNPQIPVTKDILMVALQNVQSILIRATDGADVKYSRLTNISIDTATSDFRTEAAKGVELCRCPRQYTGTSCQDPGFGYYRKRKPNYLDSKDILDLVGWAEPCFCNNHTNECDRETGICINCGGNTIGEHCDQCIQGHYGNPAKGPCRPCSCPLQTNSFSNTCIPDSLDYVCVDCQVGYVGRHCEKCDKGYYGDPTRQGGRCVECNCNPYGSKSRECDQVTGQCFCHESISGRDCTVCNHGFILTEHGCKTCEDECTGILLNELYQMKLQLDSMDFTNLPKLPWGLLNKVTEAERELLPHMQEYKKNLAAGKELVNNFTFYFDLEARADGLLVRAGDFTKKAIGVSADAKDTLDEAEKLFLALNKIWRDIKDLASELDKHGMDLTGPGVATERMLLEAERILQEIQKRNFTPDKDESNRELRKAQNLLDRIRKLIRDHGRLDGLRDRMDNLQKLMGDLIKRINDDVQKPSEKAKETSRGSRIRQNDVKNTVDRISGFVDVCNDTLKEASDLIGLARGSMIDAAVKFEYLPRLLGDLNNATGALDEHRSILAFLNPLYKEKYVIPAQAHADHLEQESQRLADLFTATKELSEFPLQAAKAYQNIIDAINAAEKAALAAEKAADRAYYEAYPGTDDALTTNAAKARARSMELLLEAQRLNEEEIPELEVNLRERKRDLDKLSEDEAHGRRNNDIINRDLDALPIRTKDILGDASLKAGNADDKAERAHEQVMLIEQQIDNHLKPRFEAIHAGTIGGLGNLTKIIQQAREDVRGATRLADSADASASRVRRKHGELQLNLKDLKDKILLARQKASSIRVALTTDTSGECMRSYRTSIQPSITNSIVLNFAIKSSESNSLLFYLGSPQRVDFMAIEMVNRKIRFLWNAGGGTQVIEHSMTIETNNDQLLRSEQWFKIEANRIGNLGTLSVKRTPEGQKPDPHEVSGASPAGYTKMDLDESSLIFIGDFPENHVRPTELRASKFAGCLYEALLDGRPIGLWNFATNVGCNGCQEGATEDIDISAYSFQGGSSYAIVPQNPYYRKKDLYIVLNFKTLNEDAILFISSNKKTGDFMAIELRGGKVVYQLKFGGGQTHVVLETKKKYNTGEWIRVDAAREKFDAQILVNQEFLEEKGAKRDSFVLDLKESALYYGGVPPNFTRWPGVTFKSFFGCMRDLQIDSTPIALSRGSYYGMTVGCPSKALKTATFLGAGYLELNSQQLSSDASFSFTFATHQRDALLLLSLESKKEEERKGWQSASNYYSVALSDGRIEAKFSGETGETSLVSDDILTRGTFHTVNIVRKNRKLLLRIDDVDVAEMRLPRGAKDMEASKVGGLFLGGIKDGIDLEHIGIPNQPLAGIIQDVIFNEKLLRFDEALQFRGVDFGVADIKEVSEELFHTQQMAVSPADDSCTVANFPVGERGAWMTPANGQSYQKLEIGKGDLLKNFNITFEFRTHYSEGVLFYVKNHMKKQELILYIRNSSMDIEFKRRGKHKQQHMTSQKLKTGKWHKVQLLKSGQEFSMLIDNKLIASFHHAKSLGLKSPLYVGGAPEQTLTIIDSVPNFYGCLKNFDLNNVPQQFSSVTPCFKTSEPGNYFTGTNYIPYDSAFYLTDAFTIDISFKTSQLDADILSIYSKAAKLWFQIQINDGQVLGTVFLESDLRKIQLSRSLESRYAVCDNQWHYIHFSYKHGTLSLKLDNQSTVDKKLKDQITGLNYVEIFIGGLPKKRLTSLSQPFTGCLQAISINDNILDLRDSEDTTGMLFSCPGS